LGECLQERAPPIFASGAGNARATRKNGGVCVYFAGALCPQNKRFNALAEETSGMLPIDVCGSAADTNKYSCLLLRNRAENHVEKSPEFTRDSNSLLLTHDTIASCIFAVPSHPSFTTMKSPIASLSLLTGVPETLLMTLYCRAQETQRSDRLIADEPAVQLVARLQADTQHDFSKFDDWRMQWGVAVRTLLIDRAVQQFLTEHPQGCIVTLGAGLCTRSQRFDNGEAIWLSVDLPVVQPYWDQLIGTTDRNQFIGCSATDLRWTEPVIQLQRPTLFIAEGLFMYLTEAEVKQVVLGIQQVFPGATLIAEILGMGMIRSTQLSAPSVARTGSKFLWGSNHCRTLEDWNPGIKLLDEWFYFDYGRDRQGRIAWVPYLFGGKRRFGKVGRFCLR
jgi:O-methyltransferase involved in polyketide biosynthesis